ncbi:MAG: signal recognition particle-docking protein FtsY [Deltaproteobacteria bacterium]|nr:signal recognition particle-docking protein FtsY [Deltaproteobacteria bacterium]
MQLLKLGVAVVGVALVILLLRRASAKSRANASAQARLGLVEEEPVGRPRRPRPDRKPARPVKVEGREGRESAAAALARRRREAAEDDDEEEDEDSDIAAAADDDDELTSDAGARAAFKTGLAKTRGGFVAKLGKIFGKKKIDSDLLGELEEVLFTADIGPRAADRIFHAVKGGLTKDQLEDPKAVWRKIRDTSAEILSVDAKPFDWARKKPLVMLVLGVNGVGKTTTIGKLAALLARDGKKVILAAGDTFRAAATEQLEEWGKRASVPVVKGKAGGDPSSVIFDAIKRGVDEGADVIICDTAGRLQTNAGLMDELKKIRRVMDKACPGSPHETWMVLDSTTGQNAISQAKIFKSDMEITGIVLTKLDGSAKGGVILGICDELKVPVRYIGVGEQIDDLRPFDARAFVDALYEDAGEATS